MHIFILSRTASQIAVLVEVLVDKKYSYVIVWEDNIKERYAILLGFQSRIPACSIVGSDVGGNIHYGCFIFALDSG